jgi:hypothetical protein
MFLLSEVRRLEADLPCTDEVMLTSLYRLFPEQLVRVEGLQNFGSESNFYSGVRTTCSSSIHGAHVHLGRPS